MVAKRQEKARETVTNHDTASPIRRAAAVREFINEPSGIHSRYDVSRNDVTRSI